MRIRDSRSQLDAAQLHGLLDNPAPDGLDPHRSHGRIRQTFQQRRKKLANALTSLVEKDKAMEILDKAKIDGELRPENISLENYVQLTNVMDELNQEKKREG